MNKTIHSHFEKADPILYEWIYKIQQPETITPAYPKTFFARLCDEIISQQLAGKAADAIHRQIEAITAKWKPYRTYASRILWRSLEIE